MSKIPINKVGLVLEHRQHKGWYIRVEPEQGGGHIILYSERSDFGPGGKGFDDWVLEEELENYFDDKKVKVDWSL